MFPRHITGVRLHASLPPLLLLLVSFPPALLPSDPHVLADLSPLSLLADPASYPRAFYSADSGPHSPSCQLAESSPATRQTAAATE